jgi:hypothetical protein
MQIAFLTNISKKMKLDANNIDIFERDTSKFSLIPSYGILQSTYFFNFEGGILENYRECKEKFILSLQTFFIKMQDKNRKTGKIWYIF